MKIYDLNNSLNQLIQYENGEFYLKHVDPDTNQTVYVNLQDISKVDYQDKTLFLDKTKVQQKQIEEEILRFQASNPFQWIPIIPTSEQPSPRGGHSLDIVGEYLIIFGGCNLDILCYNDLYYFNTRSKEWFKPKTFGDPPSPRNGHTSVLHGSFLYIFGGASMKGLLNDLYKYDLENVISKISLAESDSPQILIAQT